ncbi:hypothetical protein EVAR_53049_1 [Eumeta japonica]|uniref:Uncharacterized protein n=1 Tax=Eumeta variegata TaxID=151549 RepID=A0A4C1YW35_EUMVA|nr:hypothetical protein EVAR_53049_1 [Eumeta japonica]
MGLHSRKRKVPACHRPTSSAPTTQHGLLFLRAPELMARISASVGLDTCVWLGLIATFLFNLNEIKKHLHFKNIDFYSRFGVAAASATHRTHYTEHWIALHCAFKFSAAFDYAGADAT